MPPISLPSTGVLKFHRWPTSEEAERVVAYQVPGVSIAVIDVYKRNWAKGYGVRTAGESHL